MGAIAVVEPQSQVLSSLTRYGLSSPSGLIRMMIQQSNCFIVVERGAKMQNLMQERALATSGQARQDSNMGGGMMVAADFVLTPAVVFAENNAGGMGGAVAGLLGRRAGAVAGGGYGNTNEGKIIAAAFLDNDNKIVDAVRNDPSPGSARPANGLR
jgi:hypothetical protein